MSNWILQRYQAYGRLLLVAGLLLSPLLYRRDTVDVFSLVKLTVLFVTAILAVALWVVLALERGVWLPRLRIFWAAGAFLAAQALATALSQNLSISVLGVVHRYGGLIPFLLYATIAAVTVGLYWECPGKLKEIPRAIAVASFLVACDILMQKLGLDWIPWRNTSYTPSFPVGTFGNSNFAGGFLAVAAPLFAYVVLSTPIRRRRWLLAGAFAVDLLALWFTQTRGAFIGLGLALAVLALLAQDKLPRWLRRLAVVGMVAGAGVSVLVVFHPGMRAAPSFFSAAGAFSPFRTGTFQDRSYYWIAALRIFRHHPILGTGPDTYAANYSQFRLAQDGAKLGLTLTDKPHNIFFEYAANSGAVGVATYLGLLGSALLYGYRRVRQLVGDARLLLMMFMASLVAYIGQGFFSIDLPAIAVMGWVALAGIAILADPGAVKARLRLAAQPRVAAAAGPAAKPAGPGAKPAGPGAEPAGPGAEPAGPAAEVPPRGPGDSIPPGRRGGGRRLAQALAMWIALLLIMVGVRPLWADHLAYNAQLLQGQPGVSPSQAAAGFAHASAFAPLEPSYLSMAGSVYEAAGDKADDGTNKTQAYELALGPYQRALRLQPHDLFLIMNLARVHTSWAAVDASHFPLADQYWQRALRQDPTDWQVHEFYALMLASWAGAGGDPGSGDRRLRSLQEFQTVAHINPGDVTAWINLVKLYRSLGDPLAAERALATATALGPANPAVLALMAPRPVT